MHCTSKHTFHKLGNAPHDNGLDFNSNTWTRSIRSKLCNPERHAPRRRHEQWIRHSISDSPGWFFTISSVGGTCCTQQSHLTRFLDLSPQPMLPILFHPVGHRHPKNRSGSNHGGWPLPPMLDNSPIFTSYTHPANVSGVSLRHANTLNLLGWARLLPRLIIISMRAPCCWPTR